jgi:alpha-L-fucosidase
MAQLLKGSRFGGLLLWGIYVVLCTAWLTPFVTIGLAQDTQDRTAWMKEAKWSVMTYYLADRISHVNSESMSIKRWNGLVDHFDMEELTEGVGTSASDVKKAVLPDYFIVDNVRVYDAVANLELSTDEETKQLILKAVSIRPSPQQLGWQKMEFVAFIHFTVNTFTDKEWGDGTESPSIFNPTQLDTQQWVKVCKDAGMKMIILTAKHHDGFCLWPSKYTEHSVKNSPWRNGKGDVVRELADACRESGLKLGLYLSPWDRHEPTYGDTESYNKFYKNQLTELLSNYREVAEVWFDGAKGENAKDMEYDWLGFYAIVRELQPNAVIFNGPDIRWVGNEAGYARESEWSVVNRNNKPFDFINQTQKDLGSLEALGDGNNLIWYPAETDVSIRPGWFYHASEDDKVKSVEKLLDIYYGSVGRNSVLLLNLPPDRRGLIHENDVKRLQELRKVLDAIFAKNLAIGAQAKASPMDRTKLLTVIRKPIGPQMTGLLLPALNSISARARPSTSQSLLNVSVWDRGLMDLHWRLGTAMHGRNLSAAQQSVTSGCCVLLM